MIVLAPDLAEDGFKKQLEAVRKIIESGGGTIVNDDRWGIRSLAYQIGKHDQGYYTVIEWQSTPDVIAELDHTLRLEEKVLRHMVLHLDQTALDEQAETRARAVAGSPVDTEDTRANDVPDVEDDGGNGNDIAPESDNVAEEETVTPEPSEEPEPAETGTGSDEVEEEADATGDEADDVEEAEEEKS